MKFIYGLSLCALLSPRVVFGEYQHQSSLLTEREQRESSGLHKGLVARTLKEQCDQSLEHRAACDGDEATVFGSGWDTMIKSANMAYSLVMGPMMGDGKISPRNPQGTEGEDQGTDDYCRFISMGMTSTAQAQQLLDHKTIQEREVQPGEVHKANLYQKASTHSSGARGAKIEAIGWGLTASCYAALSIPYGFQVNTGTYVKMGAASFLSAFYSRLQSNHKKYQEMVLEMANSLPGPGDCNPITDRNCYCAQPETATNATYCLPVKRNPKTGQRQEGQLATVCITAQNQIDYDCLCAQTNTCMDQNFKELFSIAEFTPQSTAGNLLQTSSDLLNGQTNPSLLGNSSFGQGALRRALKKIDPHIPTPKTSALSKEEKGLAQTFARTGLPPRLAAQLAKAAAMAPSASKNILARAKKTNAPTRKADRAPRLTPRKLVRNKASRKPAGIPIKLPKGKHKRPGDHIIRYAQKAQNQASISQSRGQDIFQLISRRYQHSGWDKLEFSMP